jgi:hypothetical protein
MLFCTLKKMNFDFKACDMNINLVHYQQLAASKT